MLRIDDIEKAVRILEHDAGHLDFGPVLAEATTTIVEQTPSLIAMVRELEAAHVAVAEEWRDAESRLLGLEAAEARILELEAEVMALVKKREHVVAILGRERVEDAEATWIIKR